MKNKERKHEKYDIQWPEISNEFRYLSNEKSDIFPHLKDKFEGIIKRFKEGYESQEGIEAVNFGVYHGGENVIGVVIEIGAEVELPSDFEGIPVMIFSGSLPMEIENKFEEEKEKYRYYLTMYYPAIEEILKKENLSIVLASKEKLKDIVNQIQRKKNLDDMDLEYELEKRFKEYGRKKHEAAIYGHSYKEDSEFVGKNFEEIKKKMRIDLIKKRKEVGHF